MFHTFETAQCATQNATVPAKLKISNGRACEPCRRSKIRCSGEHPCEGCQWYRRATSCHYTEPRKRPKAPRRSDIGISQMLQEHRSILRKLFPDIQLDQLKDLSRKTLVELIQTSSTLRRPFIETLSVKEKTPRLQLGATDANQLQRMPGYRTDSFFEQASEVLKVNMGALDLLLASAKQNSTYLGVSSVLAVMRVITWLDPGCLSKTAERSGIQTCEANEAPAIRILAHDQIRANINSTLDRDEIPLINAYFTYVHPFIPLIEERVFREMHLAAQRTDSRWLLLLNSVLAIGSVSASKASDLHHHVYFNRAKQYLDTEILNSIHLETIQALAILSGFYLHYIQLPNQANSLMEATLRVASMLSHGPDVKEEGFDDPKARNEPFSIEMLRKTFKSSDWGNKTFEKPCMGRINHAMKGVPSPEPIDLSMKMLELVRQNVWLSVIATRIYDALAVSPLLKEHERHDLDALHLEWYQHSTVRQGLSPEKEIGSPVVTIMENVMRWKYFTNRIILYRPVLLWYAMRQITWEKLPDEKKAAIEVCRKLCNELIHDIATTWRGKEECQISGWNATWLLYQATMVPLVSLYSRAHSPNAVDSCRQEVDVAICAMKDLQSWCPTARRSLEVIMKLYNRSKRQAASTQGQGQQVCSLNVTDRSASSAALEYLAHPPPTNWLHPTCVDISIASTYPNPQSLGFTNQELFMDNNFDKLNWSPSWEGVITGPHLQPNGWDYGTTQSWPGIPQADECFSLGCHENASRIAEMSMQASNPADFIH